MKKYILLIFSVTLNAGTVQPYLDHVCSFLTQSDVLTMRAVNRVLKVSIDGSDNAFIKYKADKAKIIQPSFPIILSEVKAKSDLEAIRDKSLVRGIVFASSLSGIIPIWEVLTGFPILRTVSLKGIKLNDEEFSSVVTSEPFKNLREIDLSSTYDPKTIYQECSFLGNGYHLDIVAIHMDSKARILQITNHTQRAGLRKVIFKDNYIFPSDKDEINEISVRRNIKVIC